MTSLATRPSPVNTPMIARAKKLAALQPPASVTESTPVTRNLDATLALAEAPSVETIDAPKPRAKRPYVKRGPRMGKLADSLAKLGDFIPTLPTPAPIEPEQPQSRALRLIGSTRLGLPTAREFSPSLELVACEIDITPVTRNRAESFPILNDFGMHTGGARSYAEQLAHKRFLRDNFRQRRVDRVTQEIEERAEATRRYVYEGRLSLYRHALRQAGTNLGYLLSNDSMIAFRRDQIAERKAERDAKRAARAEAKTPVASNPPAREIDLATVATIVNAPAGKSRFDSAFHVAYFPPKPIDLATVVMILVAQAAYGTVTTYDLGVYTTPPVDPTPDMGKETPVTDTQEKPIMPIGWSESFTAQIKGAEYTVSRRDIPGLRSYKVENGRSDYDVDETNSGRATCSCPDYRARHADLPFTSGCKHIQALVAAGKLTNEFPKIEETPATQAATPVMETSDESAAIDLAEAELEELKAARDYLRGELRKADEAIALQEARIRLMLNPSPY